MRFPNVDTGTNTSTAYRLSVAVHAVAIERRRLGAPFRFPQRLARRHRRFPVSLPLGVPQGLRTSWPEYVPPGIDGEPGREDLLALGAEVNDSIEIRAIVVVMVFRLVPPRG